MWNQRLFSLLCYVINLTLSYEITESTPDTLIAVGEHLELTCDFDGEYDLCEWRLGEEWSCLTYGNAMGEGLACEEQDRATITGSEGSCTIGLEDVSLDDQGDYQCMVGKLEEGELVKSEKIISVSVAMQASLEFGGDIAEIEEKWMVLEDEEITFSCHGNGGSPPAEVLGFIGSEEEINEDEDAPLDESTFDEVTNGDDERLLDVSKVFSFIPTRDDCGKYLKCASKQMNDDGELVFEDIPSLSKQIMVVYPPKAHEDEVEAVFDEETAEPVEIEIRFEAHPAPSDDQVTWHLGDETIHAGEDLEDKFSAHPLETGDGDWVVARLTVNYMSEEDADMLYQLSAENEFSSDPIFYNFNLGFEATTTTTTTTTTSTTTTTETDPETSTFKFRLLLPEVQAEGIGGGSIAAIVIIIIVIIISGICIIWLKRNEQLCFAVYEEVDQKADIENGNVKSTSIVKE